MTSDPRADEPADIEEVASQNIGKESASKQAQENALGAPPKGSHEREIAAVDDAMSPARDKSSPLTAGRLLVIGLLLVLLIGAYFRLTGVNWDSDQHLHPDERFMTMVA